MSQDNSLIFPASIDLDSLDRDIVAAEAMVDTFASSAASKLGNMPVAKLQFDGALDAGELAAGFSPIAGKIQSSLHTAVAPLTSFAADFNTKFDEVGSTVEKLSVRIDDAMRFPAFVQRYESFLTGFRRAFGIAWKEVDKQAQDKGAKAFAVEADATKLVGSFKTVREEVKEAVAPIPGDVGYALNAAGGVDAKASFASYLAGLDEVSSQAIDKMKRMAEAVQNATGKGSRIGRRNASARAGDLASKLASVPPRDNTTSATIAPNPPVKIWKEFWSGFKTDFATARDLGLKTALLGAPPASGWAIAGTMIKQTAVVTKILAKDLQTVALVAAMPITILTAGAAKAYLGWQKLKAVTSTFGSVANASFGKIGKVPVPSISPYKNLAVAVKGVGSAASAASGPLKYLASQASLALGLFNLGYKAIGFLTAGAKGASDLAETMNRVDVSLGTGAPAAKAFADDLQQRFGIAKNTSLDTAASFAGLGKSLGRLNGQKLTDFSKQFTMMSADLSSFANVSVDEAGEALRTALSGNQSDKLKELGVVYTEDTVKAYAYSHGIAAVGTELNEQQKFMARSAIITQGLAKVHGDLEKTQGGAANQGRKLMGTIENIGVSIGTAFMPAITEGIGMLSEFASWASKTFEDSKATIQGWSDTVISAFDWVVAVVHNFPSAFEVARLKIFETLANIGEYIAVLGPNAVIIAKYIGDNWLLLIGDAFDATVTALKNLWSNFQAVGKAIGAWFSNPAGGFHVDWTPLLDGFQATAAKFPELVKPALHDMSKEIAAAAAPITTEVTARRAKREMAKNIAAAPLKDTPIADEALKKKKDKKDKDEVKFAGALELGSKEAYSSIVAASSGRGNGMDDIKKSGKDTASNTAELVNIARGRNNQGRRTTRMEIG
jgi:hypothetical protein